MSNNEDYVNDSMANSINSRIDPVPPPAKSFLNHASSSLKYFSNWRIGSYDVPIWVDERLPVGVILLRVIGGGAQC